ncbi:MAG: DHHW family protein [Prevotella sp.]|nr:DHHW family protein [Alistipes senegalensis]MCM1358353.1 DHHW family protein [Prevotella sp.]
MKIPEISGKITSFITVTALTAGLILTVIGKKSDFSINENRKLASFPEFSVSALTDGSYGKQLNKYITDHFFMREKWVSAQACIESCMGEKIINGVYIDSKGLLDAEISSRCISEKNINAVNKFFADYTGTVYFTAVPTASGIYGDKLPEYLMTNPEKNQIDFLYDNLTDGIRTIDTYNILRMLNDNYIYYRNDTRLTSYGAYYVYRTIIQKLGFKPSSYDKYTIKHITSDFRGNLYNRCLYNGTKSDILDVYSYSGGAEVTSCTAYCNNGMTYRKTLNDETFLESGDMYRMYIGMEEPFIRIKTSVNNEKKLLLIKDSYADCFIQFLIQHYSEIAVISPEHMKKPISSFINPDNYEQTLFLFGIESMDNENLFDFINK